MADLPKYPGALLHQREIVTPALFHPEGACRIGVGPRASDRTSNPSYLLGYLKADGHSSE